MRKVPLVTYETGERQIIGEAEVDIQDGDVIVNGHVFDRDHAAHLFDESMTGFSIQPKDGNQAIVSWRTPLKTHDLFHPTINPEGDSKGIDLIMTVPRKQENA